MTEYTPCPSCGQYSHSIGEDRVTAAFNHFQSMSAMPIQNAFDEQTRDYAQVLVAEITRLRADLKVAGAESAGLQAGLVDAIFQKKLAEGYKVDAAGIHAKAFVDWSLTQLRNELALIEGDE